MRQRKWFFGNFIMLTLHNRRAINLVCIYVPTAHIFIHIICMLIVKSLLLICTMYRRVSVFELILFRYYSAILYMTWCVYCAPNLKINMGRVEMKSQIFRTIEILNNNTEYSQSQWNSFGRIFAMLKSFWFRIIFRITIFSIVDQDILYMWTHTINKIHFVWPHKHINLVWVGKFIIINDYTYIATPYCVETVNDGMNLC